MCAPCVENSPLPLPELRQLIEALPECAPKAALRGIASACVHAGDSEVPDETLQRMRRIVHTWSGSDPLRQLEAALDKLDGESSLKPPR
jgi:hypothetical protein